MNLQFIFMNFQKNRKKGYKFLSNEGVRHMPWLAFSSLPESP